MFRRQAAAVLLIYTLLLPGLALAQQPQPAPAKDANDPIERIKEEGMQRSQVMATLGYLSDVIGPRLTASPNMKRANEWTRDKLTAWGLANAHLEAWGPFGRGWTLKSFSAQVSAPQSFPLIAYPKAWSPGINIAAPEPAIMMPAKKGKPAPAMMMKAAEPSHTLTADVVYLEAKDAAELDKYKGQLKGKIVLISPMREVKAHFEAPGTRMTEKELLEMADSAGPAGRPGRRFDPSNPRFAEIIKAQTFNSQKAQFIQDEGAALLVDASRAGDGGTVFVQQANVPQKVDPANPMSIFLPRVAAYDKDAPAIVPQMSMAVEHYNRVVRMLQAGEKVQMTVNLDVQFHDQDLMGYNTVAEIPGTDKAGEIVMLGGHMDSWHGGTGATDNGAGVAVSMEAVRILQALGLKPRRTIRIALWSGEEQGLFGSRAYVGQHLGKIETTGNGDPMMAMMTGGGGPRTIIPGAEYDKISAYYNLDNGTGKIRGVYMEGNEGVRPYFRKWLEPFREMGAATLTTDPTSGTDHQSFDAIGVPGFQFIQDVIEYDSRTHHSNMDVFDRIQADDMKQSAIIMAAFIYNTAMLDEKLPRKTVNIKK